MSRYTLVASSGRISLPCDEAGMPPATRNAPALAISSAYRHAIVAAASSSLKDVNGHAAPQASPDARGDIIEHRRSARHAGRECLNGAAIQCRAGTHHRLRQADGSHASG